jgi:hypothetical protein
MGKIRMSPNAVVHELLGLLTDKQFHCQTALPLVHKPEQLRVLPVVPGLLSTLEPALPLAQASPAAGSAAGARHC